MPGPLMVPPPVPLRVTLSEKFARPNVAATARPAAWFIVTVQGPVPVHDGTLQPTNVEPIAGVAVSVTIVFAVYCSEQSVPQLMPPGADVTEPLPAPGFDTDSV